MVFIAPKDLVYGLSRMFVTLGEQKRFKARVVRTVEEAYHLSEVDSPQLVPITVR